MVYLDEYHPSYAQSLYALNPEPPPVDVHDLGRALHAVDHVLRARVHDQHVRGLFPARVHDRDLDCSKARCMSQAQEVHRGLQAEVQVDRKARLKRDRRADVELLLVHPDEVHEALL